MRSLLSCLLIVVGALVSGCTTYTMPPPVAVGAIKPALDAAAFSDEVGRDQIQQTRKLLELKNRDYLVGPDDVLEISIFEWEMTEETKTLTARVEESGVISLPVVGTVIAAGKTVREIQSTIETDLSSRNILTTPRVAVSVSEYRSRTIAVIGSVEAPGVYAIHENVTTLMDMLTLAGGPSGGAGEIVHVLRERKGSAQPLRITVDMDDLFTRGKFDLNAVLQGGDVVYVPKAPLIYVYGEVKSPGGFSLHRSMRTLEVIALAGGFTKEADRRRCILVRRTEAGSQQTLLVDALGIERGRRPDIFLREGDVLQVRQDGAKVALLELWDVFRGIFTFTYRLDSPSD